MNIHAAVSWYNELRKTVGIAVRARTRSWRAYQPLSREGTENGHIQNSRFSSIHLLIRNMKKMGKYEWVCCGKHTEICNFCCSYLLLKCPDKSCYALTKSNTFVLPWHQLKMWKIMDFALRLKIHLG